MDKSNKLTTRQQAFVDEYLIDFNGAQAAIRAGYSKKTAKEMAYELLTRPHILEAVNLAKKKREERTHITQDRVLQELARIAFFDLRKLYNDDGSLKRPNELDDDAAAVLAGIDTVESKSGDGEDVMLEYTKKAKVFDKNAALTLAMRHLGMLNDKISQNHSGNVGLNLVIHDTPDPDASN